MHLIPKEIGEYQWQRTNIFNTMIKEIIMDKIFTSVVHKGCKRPDDQCTDVHAGYRNGGEKKKKKTIRNNKFSLQ